MKFDRGFIKWQPFNAVIPSKVVLNSIKELEVITKPTLFPEELDNLNELLLDAYYSQSKIKINFYEQNKIKTIETKIIKLNPNTNTIVLANNKTLFFKQIMNITSGN